jgi:hypothetical protein
VKASEVLQSATDVIGQRGAIYGSPKVNHQRISARLSQLLETPIKDWQACLIMVEVKMSRIQETPSHVDSYIDACAYLALACELINSEDELYV